MGRTRPPAVSERFHAGFVVITAIVHHDCPGHTVGHRLGPEIGGKIEDCRSKIEDKTESLRAEIANMRTTIDKGVLPVTAIRLEQIERDIRKIEEHQK